VASVVGNEGPLSSYFFEALVTLDDRPDSPLTIRGWFQKPGKTRWEISTPTSEYPRTFLIVADEAWSYDPKSNHYSYRRGLFEPGIEPGMDSQPGAELTNYDVGFVPGYARTVLSGLWPKSEELILGRTVTAHRADSSQVWFDAELGFVMRLHDKTMLADGTWLPFDAEIVRLAYNVPLDSSVFEFTPPPGAIAVHRFSARLSGVIPGLAAADRGR